MIQFVYVLVVISVLVQCMVQSGSEELGNFISLEKPQISFF
jgi:hypothetical protein